MAKRPFHRITRLDPTSTEGRDFWTIATRPSGNRKNLSSEASSENGELRLEGLTGTHKS
jgi:hypothetical protein